MIFKKIRLQNFRQYKGDNIIEFSPLEQGKITLLIAENGVGKTTFIQAFRYCFYGSLRNNKYLKLPKPEELISDTIHLDIKEGETSDVIVEVSFDHDGQKYVMKRTSVFKKAGANMIKVKESSSLSFSTSDEGYKTIENANADLEMNKILPAGLSHIFMFDGERMERHIGSKDFKDELKESILGILNLKKYDTLISLLGETNKSTTVLGKLQQKISGSGIELRKEIGTLNSIRDDIDSIDSELLLIEDNKVVIEKDLSQYRFKQSERAVNKQKYEKLSDLEKDYLGLEERRNSIVESIARRGLNLLLYKKLINNKDQFDAFISKSLNVDDFYQFIHINTLEQILEEMRCICGRPVHSGSNEERLIEDLKRVALPDATAQYISFIQNDIFSQVKQYKSELITIKREKLDLDLVNAMLQSNIGNQMKLKEEIKVIEEEYGEDYQVKIDELNIRRDQLIGQTASLKDKKVSALRALMRQENITRPLIENDENNRTISTAIRDLENIKSILLDEKLVKEEKARKVLSRHFSENISNVMSGNYETSIEPNYSIRIKDTDKNNDVTDVLSTGQNVIISVSFIKSLISTAKELSQEYNHTSDYGVIMDAALSNLDETHIEKVSKSVLLDLDQLIFLSFKRQLRDEMYKGVHDEIGKAYSLDKINNQIEVKDLPLDSLADFIHLHGGEQYE